MADNNSILEKSVGGTVGMTKGRSEPGMDDETLSIHTHTQKERERERHADTVAKKDF